jgi:peptidylprolyl isomerase
MTSSSRSLSWLLLAAAATAVPAQISKPATHTATHHTTASHETHEGACLSFPEISAKVPAVPAGSACPKALYTVSRHSQLSLDYTAPIVPRDYLEDAFQIRPVSITLGYIDTKVGTGELARPGMYYTVRYAGYLPDGTKFDASDDHPGKEPLTFPYGKHAVIAGWDTGFEGMHVGGKRRIFVPYELGYGDQGKAPIPPKSTLIFDLELVSQSATPPAPKAPVHPAPLTGGPADHGTNGMAKPATPAPTKPERSN